MTRLHKYLRLSPAERSLLLRAVTLLVIFRLALWLLPYPVLRRLMQSNLLAHRSHGSLNTFPIERLTWAVRVASRFVPAATCLTQSLALRTLLTRAGHPASVRIGVAKDALEGFQAHAWVESQGQALLNPPAALARYAHLISWEGLSK
jgi:Transglutaminase-like superfamily